MIMNVRMSYEGECLSVACLFAITITFAQGRGVCLVSSGPLNGQQRDTFTILTIRFNLVITASCGSRRFKLGRWSQKRSHLLRFSS